VWPRSRKPPENCVNSEWPHSGEKLECISIKLASRRFGDVTGLSADQIAAKIEQLLLGNKDGNDEHAQ
jgi:hypothetical protein